MKQLIGKDYLVAHRGESADYPENTLPAMLAALQAGAQYLECDIQLSADNIAMVVHDSRLGRTTALDQGCIWDYSAIELQNISAGYKERFSGKFADVMMPTLQALVDLLLQWPRAHVFVELKRSSISHFGAEQMINSVLPVLKPIHGRYTLISYDYSILMHLKIKHAQAIGWVSDEVDADVLRHASELAPACLITDADTMQTRFIRPDQKWAWMIFEVNQIALAEQWHSAGVRYVETNRINNFIKPQDVSEQR
jgi:glycerophosphoryl diester phosphodiesterase